MAEDQATLRREDNLGEAPPSLELQGGERVGRFRILHEVGRGGMGIVYAAWDEHLERRIAIKMLAVPASDGQQRTRLLREAQAMARLSAPNTVTVYDTGVHKGRVFLAMEYIDGETLNEWLTVTRSHREVLEVMRAAGRGLSAAHAAGIVHRDFKLGNVMIGNDGRVVVVDFGIARAEDASAEPLASGSIAIAIEVASTVQAGTAPLLRERITGAGVILGTIGYLAPEQALEQRDDARSDQFSFCVALYRALHGEPPFEEDNVLEYLHAIKRGPRPPPAGTRASAHRSAVLQRGMSLRPEDRYPSMEALLADLARDPARARRRWAALGAAVVLALGASLGWMQQRRAEATACRAAGAAVDGAWNDATRARLRAMLGRSGDPSAAAVADRAIGAVDQWTAAWTTARVDACSAPQVGRDVSAATLEARVSCLERRREELEALLETIVQIDEKSARTLLKATYRLAPPAGCNSPSVAEAKHVHVASAEARARLAATRHKLTAAGVLSSLGRNREAVVGGEAALVMAREDQDPRLQAEVLYQIATAQEKLGDSTVAAGTMVESLQLAEESGDGVLAGTIAAQLAFLVTEGLGNPKEGARWIRLARGKLARLGPDEPLEAEILRTEALVLQKNGGLDQVTPIYERLRVIHARLFGPRSEQLALDINNEAIALASLGRLEEALALNRQAISITEELYGADDPDLALDHQNLGVVLLPLRRYEESKIAFERSYALREKVAPNGVRLAWPLSGLANVALRLDDPARALELAQRGLALAEPHAADAAWILPMLHMHAGNALNALGRPAEAAIACGHSLALAEAQEPFTPSAPAEEPLTCLGEAALALGRVPEAIAYLERAATLQLREEPITLAFSRFALARALTAAHRDPARARTLAEQARDELAKAPASERRVAEVDAWLATAARP